ncbi:MAG TPA: segregation/condensation protein A [Candidatus Saccharimonadales bacterium]|nr:segregation/condensation protein A [Candidatus Saccharimonadales bacterium]
MNEPSDFEAPGYQVRLEKFEGPLDLLLHLIQRDEVDIYDIPIARITEQYLQYLELMRELNLDVAGEFLVMAATLMRIKVKMLLPTAPPEEEEEGDPREALVRQLLEYRRYKRVAETLREREDSRRRLFERGLPETLDRDEPLPLRPVSLFDLLDVFRQVQLRVAAESAVYEVEGPNVYLEDCMERVRQELAARGRSRFADLLARCRRRVEMIVTFMALLELMRLGEVSAEQEEALGDIWIQPARPAAA